MEPVFKKKFSTLYDGMYTNGKLTLLYNTIFCMRRFFIVVINVALNSGFPLTNFERNQFLFKIVLFLLLQSLYVIYILDVMPHTLKLFNNLELVNEILLMIMAYMSLSFSGLILGGTLK